MAENRWEALIALFCFFSLSLHAELTSYKVEEASSVLELSVRLYGTDRRGTEIIQLNAIKPPYLVQTGQMIRLPAPAQLSIAQGSEAVLKYWRLRFGLENAPESEPTDEATRSLEKAFVRELAAYERQREATAGPKDLEAKYAYNNAKALLKMNQAGQAVLAFRKSRQAVPTNVYPWFYEMHLLKQLGRDAEAKSVRTQFLQFHPKLADMPFLQEK